MSKKSDKPASITENQPIDPSFVITDAAVSILDEILKGEFFVFREVQIADKTEYLSLLNGKGKYNASEAGTRGAALFGYNGQADAATRDELAVLGIDRFEAAYLTSAIARHCLATGEIVTKEAIVLDKLKREPVLNANGLPQKYKIEFSAESFTGLTSKDGKNWEKIPLHNGISRYQIDKLASKTMRSASSSAQKMADAYKARKAAAKALKA